MLATISHLYTIARKEWGMEALANPVQAIRKPSLAGTERTRRLEDDEEQRLLKAADEYGGEIKSIIELAIETGMRRSEISNARREHYDRIRKTLHIPISKNNTGRHVPISSAAKAAIDALPTRLDGKLISYTPNGITQAFIAVCKRAEIDGLHFHDLRHEGTSRLFEIGLDIMEVASITGHKTLQMLRRYTHLKAQKLAAKLG